MRFIASMYWVVESGLMPVGAMIERQFWNSSFGSIWVAVWAKSVPSTCSADEMSNPLRLPFLICSANSLRPATPACTLPPSKAVVASPPPL